MIERMEGDEISNDVDKEYPLDELQTAAEGLKESVVGVPEKVEASAMVFAGLCEETYTREPNIFLSGEGRNIMHIMRGAVYSV